LDLFDKHNIKVSSFMIGKAIEQAPDLAQEIVRRGQEAAAHGRVWSNSYNLSRDQEKRFISDCVETIHRITGQLLPLAQAGFHVIAPDLWGYGRSVVTPVRFDDDVLPYRLLNRVSDVLGLVRALGIGAAYLAEELPRRTSTQVTEA
jgi:peptidoglycan/xylan/chitin deacetylase (PgdA/CDA1 family)